MCENKLVGSLVLRTFDIEPTRAAPIILNNAGPYENAFGKYEANGFVITWKNINLRTCLGELYYKYDRFNLKLTSFQNKGAGTISDFQCIVYMSGLPFTSGSGYNTKLGPTNQVAIGCVTVPNPSTTMSILSGLVSFDKPLQNTFNITVELKNSSTLATNPLTPVKGGYPEKPTTITGHWSIMCDIYGIDKP